MVTMAKGWFQLRDAKAQKGAAKEKLAGLRVEGDTATIDASGERDAVAGTVYRLSELAVAGTVTLDQDGERERVFAGWAFTVHVVDEQPAGGRRIGSVEGACPEVVEHLAFSPDGALLAVGCCRGWGATVVVLDAASGDDLHHLMAREGESLGHQHGGTWLGFDAKGRLVTAGRDAFVRRWDPRSGRLLSRDARPEIVRAVAAAPDAPRLALVEDETSEILVLDDGLTKVDRHYAYDPPSTLQWGAGGLLLRASRDKVEVSGPVSASHYGRFEHPRLLDDGRVVAVAAPEDEPRRLVVLAPEGEPRALPTRGEPLAVDATRDGRRVVVCTERELAVLDLATGEALHALPFPTLERREGPVALSPDGLRVAFADGKRVARWVPGEAAPALSPFAGASLRLAGCATRLLGTTKVDGAWVAAARGLEGEAVAIPGDVRGAAADGETLVTCERGDEGSTLRYWDAATGAPLGGVHLDASSVDDVAISHDGGALLVDESGASIRDAGAGLARARPSADGEYVRDVAAAARADVGAFLISSPRDAVTVRPSDGAGLARFQVGDDAQALAVSPDGAFLVTAGDAIACWDARTGARRWRVDAYASKVAIAPAGDELAVASGGVLRWLDPADGRERARRVAHPAKLTALAYGLDGGLVSTGEEGSVVRWAPVGAVAAPPLPDSRALVRGALARGEEVRRAAEAKARAAERAPWGEIDAPPATRSAPLPVVGGEAAPTPVGTGGGRLQGRFSYATPADRKAALAAWKAAGAATGPFGGKGKELTLDGAVSGDAGALVRATGALARSALRGRARLALGDRLRVFVFDAASEEPNTEWPAIPPGATHRVPLAPSEDPPRHLLHDGPRYAWLLLPYRPEPGDEERAGEGEEEYEERDWGNEPIVRLVVLDAETGERLSSTALPLEPEVHPSPDGSLATFQASETMRHLARLGGKRDKTGVHLVDTTQAKAVAHLVPKGRVDAIDEVAWSTDGSLLAFRVDAERGRRLEVWDPRAGKLVKSFAEAVPFHFVGPRRIALLADEGAVTFLELGSKTKPQKVALEHPAQRLAPTAEGFAALGDGWLTRLDATGRVLGASPIDASGGRLSGDGSAWIEGSARHRLSDGARLSDHAQGIELVALSGERLATFDGVELIVRLLSTGQVLHRGPLSLDWDWKRRGEPALAWAGSRLFLCAGEALRVFDAATGRWLAGAAAELTAIAAAGGRIVTAHRHGALRIWDAASGRMEREISIGAELRRVAVDASLRRAAVVVGDAAALVDLEAGARLSERPLPAPTSDVSIACAPDGRSWALVNDGARLLGDDGAERWRREGYGLRAAVFTPDGRRLLVAADDAVVAVDAASGSELGALAGHASVRALACDADRLASAGDGALLWSLRALEGLGFAHPPEPPLSEPEPEPGAEDDRYESIDE